MTNQRITELWLKGYTKEWLFNQQALDIAYLDICRGKTKAEIKLMAQRDVEQALLHWWRTQGNL